MSPIAVAISDVRKTFPGARQAALSGVTLDIRRNEFFTLLGPSGCGKTTLLRMIAGFDAPDSGSIHLDGIDLAGMPPNRRPVNTVFQSYALFPHMSVEENIAFGLEMLGQPREAIRERVAVMMRLLQLDGMGSRRPAQLSGGQQQRVALGRALAPAPKVLLLDEPLSALDLKLRKEMQIELKRLQTETGITFVFVTHDQEEALTMSDRVAVMRNGAFAQVGTPNEIYERPADLFVAEFIGEANFWPVTCLDRTETSGRFSFAGMDHSPVLTAAVGQNILSGSRAVMVVRPERVALTDMAAARVLAKVHTVVYRGSDIMLHATLGNGAELRARLPGSEAVRGLIGQTVGFAVPNDATQAFSP